MKLIEQLIKIMDGRDSLVVGGRYYVERYLTNESTENFIITDLKGNISIYIEYVDDIGEYRFGLSKFDRYHIRWNIYPIDVGEMLKEIIYSVMVE